MAKFRIVRLPIAENSDAVRGRLWIYIPKVGWTLICNTLENKQYLIPEGTYGISTTLSPKFKRYLPLLSNVKNRSGIRIHLGTKPEHSRGCILVNDKIFEGIVNDFIYDDSSSEIEVIHEVEPVIFHHYGKE